jgi:hypothetical protein
MSRADYAHHNEEADYVWWHEEGKHVAEPSEPDDYYDDYGYEPDEDDDDGLSDPDTYAAWKNSQAGIPQEEVEGPEPDGYRYGDGGSIVPTSR